MDITSQDSTTQPISDDQELAKALAGVSLEEPVEEAPTAGIPPLESMQLNDAAQSATPPAAPAPSPAPAAIPQPADATMPSPTSFGAPTPPATPSNLEDIKTNALQELRPLMDKVELPADEKFDTYLMLLRSTDDPSLIGPAHVAAQSITDEKRKAEALLEVIKEIDYLSRKDAQA